MIEERHQRRSLAIAYAIIARLESQPEAVIKIALGNISVLRDHVSGGAVRFVDDWERLLAQRNLPAIRDVLDDRSEYGSEMRTATPFAGVLTDEEYLDALQAARV